MTEEINEAIEVAHEGFLSLNDPHTWVLFSALIFAAIVWKKGKKPFLEILDARTAKIKKELEEAEELRKQAKLMLDDYKLKNEQARLEAEKIINDAKNYAQLIKEGADIDARHLQEKREKLIETRIKKAEAEAISKINQKAADLAASAAKMLIEQNIANHDSELIDLSIKEISKKMAR